MKLTKDVFLEDIKKDFDKIISGFCTLILVLVLIYFKRQYLITIVGCIAILAMGFEKQGNLFEKLVAIAVVFFLAIGFLLI